MRFWWVNQNQTHVQEVRGGFLWSPKTKTNGHRNYSQGAGIETRAAHKIPDHWLGGCLFGPKCSQLCSQSVSSLWARVQVLVEWCGLPDRGGDQV